MGITSFVEYDREATLELKKVKKFLVPRTNLIRYFEVHTDSPATVDFDVLNHASCPVLYSPHPRHGGAICRKIHVPKKTDADNPYLFDVPVEYSDDFEGEDKEEPEDKNPLNRPLVIRGGIQENDAIVTHDIDGNPIRNSAGDPFDPAPTRKAGGARFSVTKNLPTLNFSFLRNYKNAVNSDTWWGFDPYTVRIANITFERQIEDVRIDDENTVTYVFWPHTFEFELAEPGIGTGTWRVRYLDQGFRALYGAVKRKIVDGDGMAVVQQALLNLEGAESSTPFYLPEKKIYRELPFAALNL